MQRPMTEMAAGSAHDGHMNFPIRSARRAFSVPPGRIGYNIQAPTLLLHTVQTSVLDTGNYPKTVYWQATVHELRAEDVTEAVRFEDAARPFHP